MLYERGNSTAAPGIQVVPVLRLRFGVSGHLPNAAGEDPEGFNMHSNWSCATARDGTIGDDGDDEAPKKSGLSEHGDTSWGFLEII